MFKIKSNFIWIFKVGDNINYNLKILELLYESTKNISSGNKRYLNKPIIVIIASICEAILYDFYFRIKRNINEEIHNIGGDTVEQIKGKNIDKFSTYISIAKKNELFETENINIYQELDELRKLRNRIHIQNEKSHFDPNEKFTFTTDRKIIAEKTLEQILKQMSKKYYRPSRMVGYVKHFKIPWAEHFRTFN